MSTLFDIIRLHFYTGAFDNLWYWIALAFWLFQFSSLFLGLGFRPSPRFEGDLWLSDAVISELRNRLSIYLNTWRIYPSLFALSFGTFATLLGAFWGYGLLAALFPFVAAPFIALILQIATLRRLAAAQDTIAARTTLIQGMVTLNLLIFSILIFTMGISRFFN